MFRSDPKNGGHNINIYAEVHMEIFALEGDLISEIWRRKTDNITVTDFDDYVHVHNTQTSLISQRITKEASLYIIQLQIFNLTNVVRSVIFRSKVLVAKNRLQSFEQAGC